MGLTSTMVVLVHVLEDLRFYSCNYLGEEQLDVRICIALALAHTAKLFSKPDIPSYAPISEVFMFLRIVVIVWVNNS